MGSPVWPLDWTTSCSAMPKLKQVPQSEQRMNLSCRLTGSSSLFRGIEASVMTGTRSRGSGGCWQTERRPSFQTDENPQVRCAIGEHERCIGMTLPLRPPQNAELPPRDKCG